MSQNIGDMSAVWGTATQFTGIKYNVIGTDSSLSTSNLIDLQVGGVSQFAVNKAGTTGVTCIRLQASNRIDATNLIAVGTGVNIGPDSYRLGSSGTMDVFLVRDAANTLAQRNGANAQAFRIYNTYTDASNYERGFVRWSSNVFEIGGEVLGSGTARTLKLVNPTTIQITPSNAVLQIDANVRPTSNGSNNLGIDSVRWATTFTANVVQSGYQELAEMTAPAAPAADRVRIYAQDNGSGKTQLMALFATGAAVEIAIEP